MHRLDGKKIAGTFAIEPGKEIYGELTLAGAKTSLYLRDRDFFSVSKLPDRSLKGTLHDLTKVSLLYCATISDFGSSGRGGEKYSFAELSPSYVIFGDHHIGPTERKITEIKYEIDDATTLFYDFDAFGHLVDAQPFISQLVQAQEKAVERKIETGPYPKILYFTGKQEIFVAQTSIGTISASHNPHFNFPGPKGLRLDNTILLTLSFNDPVTFDEALDRFITTLRFTEIIVGRPQITKELIISVQTEGEQSRPLTVYWSGSPNRDSSRDGRNPHPADILLDGVTEPAAFSNVLTNWIERHESWKDARFRFAGCFAKQNYYDHDRLIAAANMFDILPISAAPEKVPLSKELQDAKDKTRSLFRSLPQSPERDSVLNALGRIGESNLKHKIRHRVGLIVHEVGDRFPNLTLVTDEAVNCRNHYVHGSDASFNYNDNFHAVMLFTNTLEFVFAASDLVEAGWDIRAWCKRSTTMSHPFDAWRIGYKPRLEALLALLPAPSTTGQP